MTGSRVEGSSLLVIKKLSAENITRACGHQPSSDFFDTCKSTRVLTIGRLLRQVHPGQLVLLNLLQSELQAMGVADASINEHGVLMATVPATTSRAGVPTIGFIAHVDTSPEMPGDNVKPIVHRQYDGRDLVLPDDPASVLRLADNPSLAACIGEDIVTASGLTLLGADDKAGVAEIMAAAEYLMAHPEIAHGPVRIAFTPDEEIGRGTAHFDVARFGARCAYTLDGGSRGELEVENFSADAMTFTFQGFNTHPGFAKKRMVNAIKVAADFLTRLPARRGTGDDGGLRRVRAPIRRGRASGPHVGEGAHP